jgi:energy-coupling factor transporter ATP-binding protein EcfA2
VGGGAGSLLLITGPPGAGKSTVAWILANRSEQSIYVEGDRFFDFLAAGAVPPWLAEADAQNQVVMRAAGAAAGQYVLGGYDVVYDGVVGPWHLPLFVEACGLAELDYVILLPELDRCLRGVRTRTDHLFDDEQATRHMHTQFVATELDQRHVLLELPDSAEAVADLIATERSTGRFRHTVP